MGKNASKGGKGSRAYVIWTDDMDEVLLNTLVEYYNKGDHCQNGWKSHVYTAAIKNVQEKCGVSITKENISARIKTFDKHYSVISGMLGTSGFGWDWNKNKLSVDSDEVWNAYVEKNEAASSYRHKVVKFWEAISLVCSKDHATGEGARTAEDSLKEMTKEDSTTKEAGASSTSGSLKRQRSNDSFSSAMLERLDKFADALKDNGPKGPTSKEVFDALKDIPGLDESTILDLFDILTASARKFESLLALPTEMRKTWLLKQLDKSRA